MYRQIALAAVVVGVSSATTGAQGASARTSLAECASIASPAKRLACFDRLAKAPEPSPDNWDGDVSRGPASADPTQDLALRGYRHTGHGQWTIRNDTDANGSLTVVLATAATKAKTLGAAPVLNVRCVDAQTFVYVDWKTIVDTGGRSTVEVDLQIDGADTSRNRWSRYTDHSATGFWTNHASVEFLKKLIGRTSLVTILNERNGLYSAQFDVSGLDTAVAPLRRACDW